MNATWTTDAIARDVSPSRGIVYTGMLRGDARDEAWTRRRRARAMSPVIMARYDAYTYARRTYGYTAREAYAYLTGECPRCGHRGNVPGIPVWCPVDGWLDDEDDA